MFKEYIKSLFKSVIGMFSADKKESGDIVEDVLVKVKGLVNYSSGELSITIPSNPKKFFEGHILCDGLLPSFQIEHNLDSSVEIYKVEVITPDYELYDLLNTNPYEIYLDRKLSKPLDADNFLIVFSKAVPKDCEFRVVLEAVKYISMRYE